MEEEEVFAQLQKQTKTVLLDYLYAAFDDMTAKQRRAVFANAVRQVPTAAVDGNRLHCILRQAGLKGGSP